MVLHNWKSHASDYWKLLPVQFFTNESKTPAELKKALKGWGFVSSKTMSHDRVGKIARQIFYHLPCYEAWNLHELRASCVGRRLAPPAITGCSPRVDLIRRLETADKSQTLDKFMEIPPELRIVTYTMHFEDIDQIRVDNAIPAQPPITKVSSMVRHESLPLFYDTCRFGFWLSEREGIEDYDGPTEPSNMWFIEAAATLTDPHGLRAPAQPLGGSLTHLRVGGWVRGRGIAVTGGRLGGWIRYEVKYQNTVNGVGMTVERCFSDGPEELDLYEYEPQRADDAMESRAAHLLGIFRQRGDELMLQSTDVAEFENLGFNLE
ncbi:hypothetical protein CLAFUW4_07357 [Fulvia fulva]|uniref:Uncharacterized protein n=1 Tax=Passalora fulva TaxID=5499 RepID=A0A9Q8PAK2_PASFU|nr:uncharacterized protein CLAFUR5_07487 [Fulvia fulva]KAK4621805.1 hypothetical protein CLAFUR4_07364 [Fulvia fulva]KAK4623038.1 hypothetical protein CLAFUR0_07362 [Fulvia fulva]UJO18919.1 hypothetical protein CLAFUR5_07487 [Fulvia fulva]WPV16529.1 hypothetical protein CLAFUW4_07357 [Fulvia fulva]WPV31253.1 hypothetical protein CLAFUW7_07359 [Fulvia fulva]